MSITLNSNRYVPTIIKSGVSNFKKLHGSPSYYLLREKNGDLFVKSSDDVFDDQVDFVKDPSISNRFYAGSDIDLLVSSFSSPDLTVASLGKNPYLFTENLFDCIYYGRYVSGAWETIYNDSRLEFPLSSYVVLVKTDSGERFFVAQEEENCSIYKITTVLEKMSYIENFYLYDAVNSVNDIVICGCKTGIGYPSESVYENAIEDNFKYYENSPSVLVCTFTSDYSSFVPFCQARSSFPVLCKKDRKTVSLFVEGNVAHILCLSYHPTVNSFLPSHVFGFYGSSWQYLNSVLPFGLLQNVTKCSVKVNNNGIVYASCQNHDGIYLTYYSYEENVWKNYDATMLLMFG